MPSKTILLLNASPRLNGHTRQVLDAAENELSNLGSVNTISTNVYGEDFEVTAALWQEADGIILGAPVYTYGPPSGLYEFFKFLRCRLQEQKVEQCHPKPIGLISQGGASYSGAEQNAYILQELALSVGCSPVSGEMPGYSQAVIGQVPDHEGVGQNLLDGATGLAAHLVSVIDVLTAGQDAQQVDLRLLVVTAGSDVAPEMVEAVGTGASEIPERVVTMDVFDFLGKEIAPCRACTQYCSRDLECIYDDGMQMFRGKWLLADAIVWLIGTDQLGIDSGLVATIDRMNQTRFEIHFARGQSEMPRYLKSMGILASGKHPEKIASAIRFLRQVGVLYQHVLVSQERFGGSYIPHSLSADVPPGSIKRATVLGKEAAILSGYLKKGLRAQNGRLPLAYFPSRVNYGVAKGAL